MNATFQSAKPLRPRRMSLPIDRLPAKLAGWNDRCRNGAVQTEIARMIYGRTSQEIVGKLDAVHSAPDVLQFIFIAKSSFNQTQV